MKGIEKVHIIYEAERDIPYLFFMIKSTHLIPSNKFIYLTLFDELITEFFKNKFMHAH